MKEDTIMADYSGYKGKRVIVVVNGENGEAQEIEGTIDSVTAGAFILRPKGKTKVELIEDDDVLEIKDAPTPTKALKAKSLKPIELGQARAHLLDRHGYKLSDINALSEQEAFDFHATVDHSELGHNHDTSPAPSAAEEAVAEAEAALV